MIEVIQGDITKIQVDAIVSAANLRHFAPDLFPMLLAPLNE